MNIEHTKAQMRKGVLEFCILSILSEDVAYVSDLINKMKDAKLIFIPGWGTDYNAVDGRYLYYKKSSK